MCIVSTRRLRLLLISMSALSTVLTIIVSNRSELKNAGLFQPTLVNDSEKHDPLLCIFTTFKPKAYKLKVYRNVLFNWILLGPRIKPFLFITELDSKNNTVPFKGLNYTLPELATYLGWTVMTVPRLSNASMPYLKDMFGIVSKNLTCTFYGYSNGDILYEHDLVRTLDAVVDVLPTLGRTMVIGRRTNFNLTSRDVYLADDVTRLARDEGKLFITKAQDYFFIAHNSFPWKRVPDVVIGLPAYDNFMVSLAIRHGVSVVDATNSAIALHQSDKDGNYAGHRRKDRYYNAKVIGRRFRMSYGSTTRSQYITQVDKRNSIAVHHRNRKRKVGESIWTHFFSW